LEFLFCQLYFQIFFSSAPHGCGAFFGDFQFLLHITFRLYMTFWPAHKAMRSIAAGQNVPEKNPTKEL
jgi:hypothetical protein